MKNYNPIHSFLGSMTLKKKGKINKGPFVAPEKHQNVYLAQSVDLQNGLSVIFIN